MAALRQTSDAGLFGTTAQRPRNLPVPSWHPCVLECSDARVVLDLREPGILQVDEIRFDAPLRVQLERTDADEIVLEVRQKQGETWQRAVFWSADYADSPTGLRRTTQVEGAQITPPQMHTLLAALNTLALDDPNLWLA